MAPSIKITPNPVKILVDEGQDTGSAQVTYRSPDTEPVLWERTSGGRWRRRIISTYSGNFPLELRAGHGLHCSLIGYHALLLLCIGQSRDTYFRIELIKDTLKICELLIKDIILRDI